MKTCRFCLNQQESGDRCDACGSPFSADKPDFSEDVPEEEMPAEPKKIMYSAAFAGETVYLKSKGPKNISSGSAPASPAAPAQAASAPAPAPAPQKPSVPFTPVYTSASQSAAASRYSLISTHSLVTFIVSCVGLLCCCGMSTPSLVMSLIAYLSMKSVKNGTAGTESERLAKRANVLTIISDAWLILAAFIMFLIIII
ncbi:MAG: hypothetical protein J6Y58_10655 [Clostridiales bacterium]|nr:hypothetical protein [Clostridiales bacterium]